MDGLCFAPQSGWIVLRASKWCCGAHHCMVIRHLEKKGKEIKDIKPPAVRERTQSASGPYIKACHFNHYYSSISLFASPELPLSWNYSYLCGNSFHFHCTLNIAAVTFLSKSLIGHLKRMILRVVGWDPGRSLRDSPVHMNIRTKSEAMWELSVVWNGTAILSLVTSSVLNVKKCLSLVFGLLVLQKYFFLIFMLQTERLITNKNNIQF